MNPPRNVSAPSATTIDPMVYLDVKIEASEARFGEKLAVLEGQTQTTFAEIMGKLNSIGEKLKPLETLGSDLNGIRENVRSAKVTLIATIVAVGISVAGLAYAAVSIYQAAIAGTTDAFTAGMAVKDKQK